MSTVAFLGTGTMGLPMAQNLVSGGHSVKAWNRTRERADPLGRDGAEVCASTDQAAAGAEFLITMLSDADAVHDAASSALGELAPDAIWIQMSTIGVDGADRCAALAKQADVTLVDAPVLGTLEPAREGELVVLASGPDSAREPCRPLFDAMGKRTLWLGPVGSGSRLKVVVNSWLLGVVGVLGEAIALAEKLGLDPQGLFDAVEGGPLDLPYAKLKGEAMIERSFGDVSFRLSLARKDADLVLQAASEAGLEMSILDAVLGGLRRAEDDGHGDEDMAASYLATAPEQS